MNLTVLISGRGSNLKSLITSAKNYKVTHVISNHANVLGLDIAKEFNIPTSVIARKDFENAALAKLELFKLLKNINPDFICLAGFMQIIAAEMVQEFYGRIINIHPSLLPEFPGLETHKKVIASGTKVHGTTIHYVDEGMDTGPIIAQAKVAVLATDNEESLAARVLVEEHKIYPWVMNLIAAGQIYLKDGKVHYPAQLKSDFILNKSGVFYEN